jgi:hypothetical protein
VQARRRRASYFDDLVHVFVEARRIVHDGRLVGEPHRLDEQRAEASVARSRLGDQPRLEAKAAPRPGQHLPQHRERRDPHAGERAADGVAEVEIDRRGLSPAVVDGDHAGAAFHLEHREDGRERDVREIALEGRRRGQRFTTLRRRGRRARAYPLRRRRMRPRGASRAGGRHVRRRGGVAA